MKFLKSLFLTCVLIQPVMATADTVDMMASPEPKAPTAVSTINTINVLGQWSGDFYYMTPDNMVGQYRNTNGHCLKADGTWYMTNNQASGRWFMAGDRIYLHGGGNGFSGSAELTVIKPRVITGHWQSWTADDSFTGYFTAYWRFVSRTCLPPFAG